MLEKRLIAVPFQQFAADGDAGGVGAITVAVDASTLFKVKQKVFVAASGLTTLHLEIKEIDSNGTIWVGPLASPAQAATTTRPSKPAVSSSITSRTSVAAYTVFLGANIFADIQPRPSIDNAESTRAVYEEEPTVALRTVLVDDHGDKYNTANPFPVNAEITVDTIQLINLPYDSEETTYPTALQEVYTTYKGGYPPTGTPVQQIVVNYTDSTKNNLLSYQRSNWNGSMWIIS